jgi:tetratricopeptide (TPR) repeat protein
MPRAERRSARSRSSLARAETLAREARQRALREGNAGRPAMGARYARAGLRQLGWTENGRQPDTRQVHEIHYGLAARLLGILAEWESELGRTEYGFRLLDHAERLTAADNRGIPLLQRGLIFMRTGRERDALKVLDDAVAQLKGNPAETANLASALLNRSFAYLSLGQVRQARTDLVWCRRVATDEGHDLIAAKALHNLGYCDLLAGDIPVALQLFNVAANAYRQSAPGFLLVLATDKAAALLAAGLARDAASELDAAMASSRRQRLDQNLAEAQLTRAQAALAAGELAAARQWAAAAERRFRQRGNDAWGYVAELTRLRARSAAPQHQAPIAAEALVLAERLHGRGLANDADMAELLAARALLAAGRPDEARRRLMMVRRRKAEVPLPVSLLRRLVRAELAEREGRPGRRWLSSGQAWRWCRSSAAGSAALTCRPAPPP